MIRSLMMVRPALYCPALYPRSLNQPNGHHMRRVFESFLDLLMGVTRDTFEQPTFDVGTMLEMPELHLQSIADMSCFYALYVRPRRPCKAWATRPDRSPGPPSCVSQA